MIGALFGASLVVFFLGLYYGFSCAVGAAGEMKRLVMWLAYGVGVSNGQYARYWTRRRVGK